jgi:hypothetical protein
MNYRNRNLVQELVESRKQESIRVHDQYLAAMERRIVVNRKNKRLIETILDDFPENEESVTHNQD